MAWFKWSVQKEEETKILKEKELSDTDNVEINFAGKYKLDLTYGRYYKEDIDEVCYGNIICLYVEGIISFMINNKNYEYNCSENKSIYTGDESVRKAHEFAIGLEDNHLEFMIKDMIIKGAKEHMEYKQDNELEEEFKKISNKDIKLTISVDKSQITKN